MPLSFNDFRHLLTVMADNCKFLAKLSIVCPGLIINSSNRRYSVSETIFSVSLPFLSVLPGLHLAFRYLHCIYLLIFYSAILVNLLFSDGIFYGMIVMVNRIALYRVKVVEQSCFYKIRKKLLF